MPLFDVLMRDECGDEFSTQIRAEDESEARSIARDGYPESRVLWVDDTLSRAAARFERLSREIDEDIDLSDW